MPWPEACRSRTDRVKAVPTPPHKTARRALRATARRGWEREQMPRCEGLATRGVCAQVLRRVLQSPEGRALRRILVDLDFRQLLLGLAGRQGAQVRSAASQVLAARLLQKEAPKATPKARKPFPLPESGLDVAAFQRQQERATKALRVRSSNHTDSARSTKNSASRLGSSLPRLAAR